MKNLFFSRYGIWESHRYYWICIICSWLQNEDKNDLQMIYMDTDTTNLKYFIYARKSSENDERQIQSIDDQIKFLKSLAENQNLKILEIFEERKSAKDPRNRPAFLKMIEIRSAFHRPIRFQPVR